MGGREEGREGRGMKDQDSKRERYEKDSILPTLAYQLI